MCPKLPTTNSLSGMRLSGILQILHRIRNKFWINRDHPATRKFYVTTWSSRVHTSPHVDARGVTHRRVTSQQARKISTVSVREKDGRRSVSRHCYLSRCYLHGCSELLQARGTVSMHRQKTGNHWSRSSVEALLPPSRSCKIRFSLSYFFIFNK